MESVNITLFGKTVFTDEIKLRIFRSGDYPGLSRWTLKTVTSERRGSFDTDTHTAEKAMCKWSRMRFDSAGPEDWSNVATS